MTHQELSKHGITVKDGFGFFWGGVLSNWYKCNFTIEKIKFNCTEQHMMYNKAILFHDMASAKLILKSNDPKVQKKLGRGVSNFDQKIWSQMCNFIVLEGCYEKFNQNNTLGDILLATDGLELVEASPYDTIWGIGMAVDNPNVTDKTKWKGENRLGKVLGDVRAELKHTRMLG